MQQPMCSAAEPAPPATPAEPAWPATKPAQSAAQPPQWQHHQAAAPPLVAAHDLHPARTLSDATRASQAAAAPRPAPQSPVFKEPQPQQAAAQPAVEPQRGTSVDAAEGSAAGRKAQAGRMSPRGSPVPELRHHAGDSGEKEGVAISKSGVHPAQDAARLPNSDSAAATAADGQQRPQKRQRQDSPVHSRQQPTAASMQGAGWQAGMAQAQRNAQAIFAQVGPGPAGNAELLRTAEEFHMDTHGVAQAAPTAALTTAHAADDCAQRKQLPTVGIQAVADSGRRRSPPVRDFRPASGPLPMSAEAGPKSAADSKGRASHIGASRPTTAALPRQRPIFAASGPIPISAARHAAAAEATAAAGGALGAPSYTSDPAVQRMLAQMRQQQGRKKVRRRKPPKPAAQGLAAAGSRQPDSGHRRSWQDDASSGAEAAVPGPAASPAAKHRPRLQPAMQPPASSGDQPAPPLLPTPIGLAAAAVTGAMLSSGAVLGSSAMLGSSALLSGSGAIVRSGGGGGGSGGGMLSGAQQPPLLQLDLQDAVRVAEWAKAFQEYERRQATGTPGSPSKAVAAAVAGHRRPGGGITAAIAAMAAPNLQTTRAQLSPPLPQQLPSAVLPSSSFSPFHEQLRQLGAFLQPLQAQLPLLPPRARVATPVGSAGSLQPSGSTDISSGSIRRGSLAAAGPPGGAEPGLSWQKKRRRSGASHLPVASPQRRRPAQHSQQQREAAQAATAATPKAAKADGNASKVVPPVTFRWRQPRRMTKREWVVLLRASLVALPVRQMLDMVAWRSKTEVASPLWWARRLGSLAALTSFPCPLAVPCGLAIGILALAEFSLRVAPGRLWDP